MIGKLIKSIFGSSNDRELRKLSKIVTHVNSFGNNLKRMMRSCVSNQLLRDRLALGETLDQLLPKHSDGQRDRKASIGYASF